MNLAVARPPTDAMRIRPRNTVLAGFLAALGVLLVNALVADRQEVLEGGGKRTMDAIRAHVAAMQRREHDLLDERDRASEASLHTVTRTNALGAGVGMALVALAYGLYRRDLGTRERAAAE